MSWVTVFMFFTNLLYLSLNKGRRSPTSPPFMMNITSPSTLALVLTKICLGSIPLTNYARSSALLEVFRWTLQANNLFITKTASPAFVYHTCLFVTRGIVLWSRTSNTSLKRKFIHKKKYDAWKRSGRAA